MKHTKLFLTLLFLLSACSKTPEDIEIIKEVPFESPKLDVDSLKYTKLSVEKLLELDESNATLVDPKQRTITVDNLVNVQIGNDEKTLQITSYSAQTIDSLNLYIQLPQIKEPIRIAFLDSIPAFSRVSFSPAFITKEAVYELEKSYIYFHKPSITKSMNPTMQSPNQHLRKLREIKAQWTFSFSNFGAPVGGSSGNWRWIAPIYAREWVVIMTNYAYMLSTDKFREVMVNSPQIMGGELTNNDQSKFAPEKYNAELDRFLARKHFNCGRVQNVNGLGGGSTFGVAHFIFYSHYSSYSGWSTIAHEHAHTMGYSHSSNMTYASGNVGWEHIVSEAHVYFQFQGLLPYRDRNLLGFHLPDKEQYRDGGLNKGMMDDNKSLQYYNTSRVKKYFDNKK